MTFCDILNKYETGINVQLAMKNAGGNENVLVSAAQIFAGNIDSDLYAINNLNENDGSLRSFTVSVHGLKGSLLNLGAGRLSALASGLEQAAKNKDYGYCIENSTEFINELLFLKKKLETALNEYTETEKSNEFIHGYINKADFAAETEKLINALTDFDVDLAEEILGNLPPCLEVNAIMDCLKRYDFEAALQKTNILSIK